MKYGNASAFRAALEARLNRLAKEGKPGSLPRLRKMAVFERLMARLLIVAPDQWHIKGGVALDLRYGDRARLTKDIDLGRHDDEEQATNDLLVAASLDLGDFLEFTIERSDALDDLADGDEPVAVRYQIRAKMDGRRFENAVLDIGFSAPPPDAPDRLPGPDLLGFAGFSPIEIPAIPLDYHLAEKLHAYTGRYADGRESTRVKDLIDVLLIQSDSAFVAGRLQRAL